MNSNINKIRSVKEIRKMIDAVMLPGYSYKTNFSCSDFLVDINYKLIIKANLIRKDDKMEYEFTLDTQFQSDKEITYEELIMIKNIIEILQNNRAFVLSRLKKYTVEEYEKEQEERKKQSEMMLEALEGMIMKKYVGNSINEEVENEYK